MREMVMEELLQEGFSPIQIEEILQIEQTLLNTIALSEEEPNQAAAKIIYYLLHTWR